MKAVLLLFWAAGVTLGLNPTVYNGLVDTLVDALQHGTNPVAVGSGLMATRFLSGIDDRFKALRVNPPYDVMCHVARGAIDPAEGAALHKRHYQVWLAWGGECLFPTVAAAYEKAAVEQLSVLKTIPDALDAFNILLFLKGEDLLQGSHEAVLKDAVQKLLVLKRQDGSFQLSTGQKKSAVEATTKVLEMATCSGQLGAHFPDDVIEAAKAYLRKVAANGLPASLSSRGVLGEPSDLPSLAATVAMVQFLYTERFADVTLKQMSAVAQYLESLAQGAAPADAYLILVAAEKLSTFWSEIGGTTQDPVAVVASLKAAVLKAGTKSVSVSVTSMMGNPVGGASVSITAIQGATKPVKLEGEIPLVEGGTSGVYAGQLPAKMGPGLYSVSVFITLASGSSTEATLQLQMLGPNLTPPTVEVTVLDKDKKGSQKVTVDGATCGEEVPHNYRIQPGQSFKVVIDPSATTRKKVLGLQTLAFLVLEHVVTLAQVHIPVDSSAQISVTHSKVVKQIGSQSGAYNAKLHLGNPTSASHVSIPLGTLHIQFPEDQPDPEPPAKLTWTQPSPEVPAAVPRLPAKPPVEISMLGAGIVSVPAMAYFGYASKYNLKMLPVGRTGTLLVAFHVTTAILLVSFVRLWMGTNQIMPVAPYLAAWALMVFVLGQQALKALATARSKTKKE